VAAADDDEIYSDGLLKDLHKIGRWMYLSDYNILLPYSMNAETDWTGEQFRVWEGGYYKPLILLWEPRMHYRDWEGHFHEDIITNWRPVSLDHENKQYTYTHVKPYGEVWMRSTRNAFAGGGGPCLGERCPLWRPFRKLVEDAAGISTSDQFARYLRAGNIAQSIKDHFIKYRFLGTEFDKTPPIWDEWPDGTSEWREMFWTYFVYLHPEEMPNKFVTEDLKTEVRHIWGPHAPKWAQATEKLLIERE
jgi:hypothetical protein